MNAAESEADGLFCQSPPWFELPELLHCTTTSAGRAAAVSCTVTRHRRRPHHHRRPLPWKPTNAHSDFSSAVGFNLPSRVQVLANGCRHPRPDSADIPPGGNGRERHRGRDRDRERTRSAACRGFPGSEKGVARLPRWENGRV